MVIDASLLNTQHYKVRIKGKVEQSREGVAPSPIPWCSSYRKGSLRVTLDYGRQLYFTYPPKIYKINVKVRTSDGFSLFLGLTTLSLNTICLQVNLQYPFKYFSS